MPGDAVWTDDRRISVVALHEQVVDRGSSSCGLTPRPDRQRALRVEVDEQHPAAVLGERGTQVDGRRRLADAALLVAHRDDAGRPCAVSGGGSGNVQASAARSGRAARIAPRPARVRSSTSGGSCVGSADSA